MKLTQAYLRKLIMEELLNEQPQSPQTKDIAALQPQQQSMLDKNLTTFITNSSSELNQVTDLLRTTKLLKKIINALPATIKRHVPVALKNLAQEMSVQPKAEPTAQPPVAKGITK